MIKLYTCYLVLIIGSVEVGPDIDMKFHQEVMEIVSYDTNNLRNIRLHRARKHERYAKELPKYLVGVQISVRNFTRKPLDKKFVGGFSITRVLSNNAYKLQRPNGRTFKVNVHHTRPYGTGKGRKTTQPENVVSHNSHSSHNHVLRKREILNALNRLTY